MGAVIVDASTVRNFVNNEEEFNKTVDADFAVFDVDGDGALSKAELRRTLESFRLIDNDFGVDAAPTPEELTVLYDSIFEKWDVDGDGVVGPQEFRDGMRMIALAIADGIDGSCPIMMALEDYDNSFLRRAVDFEASKRA